MYAVSETPVYTVMPDTYDLSVRLSYIMELQRQIDSIDFTEHVIRRLVESQDRTTTVRPVKGAELELDDFAAVVDKMSSLGNRYDYHIDEVKTHMLDVLQFADNFVSVQHMAGPVSQVFRYAVIDNRVQIMQSAIEARTRLLSSKSDIEEGKWVIYKEIMERISESSRDMMFEGKDVCQAIMLASAEIETSTRRGYGNFAIFSLGAAKKYIPDFVEHHPEGNDCRYVGDIGGRVKAFVSKHLAEDIIVGYKGSNNMDAGLIFTPYMMFYGGEHTDNMFYRGNIVNFADSDNYFKRVVMQ